MRAIAKVHTVSMSKCLGGITELSVTEKKRVFTLSGVWDGFCPITSPDKYPEVIIDHDNKTYRGSFRQVNMGYNVPVEIRCTLFQ
jgi:hypothetical protein